MSRQIGIAHYIFFYYGPDDNPIQRAEESFLTLTGIAQYYQYDVSSTNLLYMRKRSCWCINCMVALREGTLEWGPTSYQVQGCIMAGKRR